MKKRIFTLILFLTIGFWAQSQSTLTLLKNMEENHFLENETLEGRHMFMLGGSALASISNAEMSLLKPFVFGGHITDDVKASNLSLLKESNKAGFSLNTELLTAHRTDEIFGKNSMLFIGISYRNFGDFLFSKQQAQLILEGNSALVGQNISLKNLHYQNLAYGSLRVGFAKQLKKSENRQHYYGLSLGFVNAVSHFSVSSKSGFFNTETETYNIQLDAEYDLKRSDTSNLSLFKGQGVSSSLFYALQTKKLGFHIGIEELGLISWKNGMNENKKLQHHFSGIAISDITKADEVSSISTVADSIRNSLVYAEKTEDYQTLLPMSAVASISYRHNLTWGIEGYVRYYPNLIRGMEGALQLNTYFFKQRLRVSPFVYSSGYGTYNPGLELAMINVKKIYIKTGCYSLLFSKATLGAYTAIGYKL